MPSVLSHPAVPLSLAAVFGAARVPPYLTAAACLASVAPDLDAIGFEAGIPYAHPLGHRGFTHSLCFALLLAAGFTPFARRLGASSGMTFTVVFVSAASHGLLDAMTTGGLGVAFFSPFSNERHFLPWRVILVSPIGIAGFFSRWGLRVLASELLWIWAPAVLLAAIATAARRRWGIS